MLGGGGSVFSLLEKHEILLTGKEHGKACFQFQCCISDLLFSYETGHMSYDSLSLRLVLYYTITVLHGQVPALSRALATLGGDFKVGTGVGSST